MHASPARNASSLLFAMALVACGGADKGASSPATSTPASTAAAETPTSAVGSATPSASVASAPAAMPAAGLTPGAAMADAGPDRTVALPETRVLLDGSAQGSIAEWTQVSGPATAAFKNTKTPKTWVAVDSPGEYVLRLVARDDSGASRSDDVKLTVSPNPVVIGPNSTPLDHMKAQAAPVFKIGHTLLPLTMSYGGLGSVLYQEAARRWGYAYPFPAYGSMKRESASYWSADIGNTLAFIQDIKANPGRYKVWAGNGSLHRIFNNYDGQDTSLPALDVSTWLRDAAGNVILDGGRPVVSPLARDDQLARAGEFVGNTLAALEETLGQSIDIYLNEGEYGLWIPGDHDYETYFGRDPRVLQAYRQSGMASWVDFNSFHKARQERQLKLAIFKNLKKPPPYSWYQESYGGDRGRWAGWSWWMFKYEHFIGADAKPLVSDYAQPESYYLANNTGWSGLHQQQGIPDDALTIALKSVGGSISLGQRYFYPWMSMGWEGSGQAISDDERYMGMLKMWYAAGAIGSVAGYFNYADPVFTQLRTNAVVGAQAPVHIRQLMLHGHVQALFSHLEEYTRGGDLLPGPNDHIYSSYTAVTPAMEFPINGEVQDVAQPWGTAKLPTARLLARKIRGEDRWLLAVWASTGNDRTVTATIDAKLGRMNLVAPRAGAVYTARLVGGRAELTRIDVDPMHPTKTLFP